MGDLDNTLSLEVHRRAITDLVEFFDAEPEFIACDLHPDYASTQHAEQLAATWNIPLFRIQHHHAHVLVGDCRARVSRAPCWGSPGTAPATAWTARSGAARRSAGRRHRNGHASPTCARFPCPAATGRRASRVARHWACCTSVSGTERARSASRWFRESELSMLLAALQRPESVPPHQQHGPTVRRRGRPVRSGNDGEFRGAGGHEPRNSAAGRSHETGCATTSRSRDGHRRWPTGRTMLQDVLDDLRRRRVGRPRSRPGSTTRWPTWPCEWPSKSAARASC